MSDDDKKPRRSHGEGSIFQKPGSKKWVIQYYTYDPETGGRERKREYTGFTNRKQAQNLLSDRLNKIAKGEQFETTKTKVADLYDSLRLSYLNNGNQGAARALGWRWEHLQPAFGGFLAAHLTTDAVARYTRQRQEQGAANATINRELASLRRMMNLGRRSTPPKVYSTPYIPMLREDNVRKGFVEDEEFSKLTANASELWLRTFLEMAYTYGWRRGELLKLKVRQVNLTQRTVLLDSGTTKNKEGREVTMTAKLAELLKAAVSGKKADDLVFTRADRSPVRDLRKTWSSLCVRSGLGEFVCLRCKQTWGRKKCKCAGRRRQYRGLLIHDFRRSAAKALRRAGVPESVIMATGGWKTAAMFRRYAIVSSSDQREAMAALERSRAEKANSPQTAPISSENAPKVPAKSERMVQ